MKKIKFLGLFSAVLMGSSLAMTVPVSASTVSPNVTISPGKPALSRQDSVPDLTTSFILTGNTDPKTISDETDYLKSQGVKVISVIPEIGWIEIDRPSQQQNNISKHNNTELQIPDKRANDSYFPTDVSVKLF